MLITLNYELGPFQPISVGFVLRNPPSSTTATKQITARVEQKSALLEPVPVPEKSISSNVLQARGKVK